MTQTVTALYDDYDSAVSAVTALEASGVPHSEISIVSNNVDNRYNPDRPANAAETPGRAPASAPHGRRRRSADWSRPVGNSGCWTGCGCGLARGYGRRCRHRGGCRRRRRRTCGLAHGGRRASARCPILRRRRATGLVTARVDDARASAAREILQRYKSVDPAVRGAAYRASGWSSFDENAPAYTAEQIAAERARYVGRGI